MNRQVGW